jgi:hypothetical protein
MRLMPYLYLLNGGHCVMIRKGDCDFVRISSKNGQKWYQNTINQAEMLSIPLTTVT